MIEIERKFLVKSDAFINEAHTKTRLIQGFLNTHPERTVRIRVKDDSGYVTVKGKSTNDGLSRFEWETKIPLTDAEALLKLCEPTLIDKIRYEVNVGNHMFEVDVFLGDNEGLIVAEVELSSENDTMEKPNWLGEEVTGQIKYYNSHLSKQPYKTWSS
ncbi:CYTH domain-containing protein [Hyunsoonleella jejuensis]|uniref:CYTH domain-containing protein n=1 Tax=Hyunsoonleella jejuensis TaxID=419940 RepID=A0A1H9BEE5_9FLAO|nr:CYTH domain-containing protein [Hyunsoonleella jejuensis]SEP87239.1 CYTH domain-containing protein [Hyunsoonleella jejuensis]